MTPPVKGGREGGACLTILTIVHLIYQGKNNVIWVLLFENNGGERAAVF